MTDHKTEAVNYLIASKIDARDDDGLKPAIAQVHATLYLAEQQRIANLIAYYALAFSQEANGTVPSQHTLKRLDVASDQIIEGLGL